MKITSKALKQSGVGLAAFALLATPLVASAASDTSNTVINANIGSTISVSSGALLTVNLAPGGSAVVSSVMDTVTVSTNNTTGYFLTLADADANTSLVSGGNSIPAHGGTHAAPTALADNTWGYAVAGGAFDTSYSAETNSTSSSSKWAGVPASGAAVTLKTTGATAVDDETEVWYGVRVNASQPAGTYTDTVTYTATTNN